MMAKNLTHQRFGTLVLQQGDAFDNNPYQKHGNYPATMIEPRTRTLLLSFRQALIIILGALEDYLKIPRSIVPLHERLERLNK